MVSRIVLNTISYHGHGAIENIVPELTARGYKKAFVCSTASASKASEKTSTFVITPFSEEKQISISPQSKRFLRLFSKDGFFPKRNSSFWKTSRSISKIFSQSSSSSRIS